MESSCWSSGQVWEGKSSWEELLGADRAPHLPGKLSVGSRVWRLWESERKYTALRSVIFCFSLPKSILICNKLSSFSYSFDHDSNWLSDLPVFVASDKLSCFCVSCFLSLSFWWVGASEQLGGCLPSSQGEPTTEGKKPAVSQIGLSVARLSAWACFFFFIAYKEII